MTHCKRDTNLDCSIIIAEMYCIEKISPWEKYSLQETEFNTELKYVFLSQRVLCCHSETWNLPMKNKPILRCTKTTRCRISSLNIRGEGHWRIQKGRLKKVFDFNAVLPIPCESDSWFNSKFRTGFYNFGCSTEKLE